MCVKWIVEQEDKRMVELSRKESWLNNLDYMCGYAKKFQIWEMFAI